MAERGNEKMTEWLDIKLETLSSEERLRLIEEIFATLTPQELLAIRDMAEQMRQSKLEEAKAAVLKDLTGRLEELGLSITDVLPRRGRKRKYSNTSKQVKYRGQNGETWSGRGNAPLWLRQLELQGHKREEFSVTEG